MNMVNVKSFFSSVVGKITTVAAVLGIGTAGVSLISGGGSKPVVQAHQPQAVSSPATANPNLVISNETVSFSFQVHSGKSFGDKWLLNDKHYKQADVQTIAVTKSQLPALKDISDASQLVGKTISGTGKVAYYKGRKEILADQLTVK